MRNSSTEELYLVAIDDDVVDSSLDKETAMVMAEDYFTDYLRNADIDTSAEITQAMVDDSGIVVYKVGKKESLSCDFQKWAEATWENDKLRAQDFKNEEYKMYLELKAKYEGKE